MKKITKNSNISTNELSNNNFNILNFEKRSNYLLKSNYRKYSYNSILVYNLMTNQKSHIVTLFKDFLIISDNIEFLRKYYNITEIKKRLKKLFEYYNETSFIFPNYTPLRESKYIYNNIIKKQKIIDEQQDYEDNQNIKEIYNKNNIYNQNNKFLNSNLFDNDFFKNESVIKLIFGTENDFENKVKNLINLIDKNENKTKIKPKLLNLHKISLKNKINIQNKIKLSKINHHYKNVSVISRNFQNNILSKNKDSLTYRNYNENKNNSFSKKLFNESKLIKNFFNITKTETENIFNKNKNKNNTNSKILHKKTRGVIQKNLFNFNHSIYINEKVRKKNISLTERYYEPI
jgi:hypothetical protein